MKRLLVFFLALGFAAGLCGCGWEHTDVLDGEVGSCSSDPHGFETVTLDGEVVSYSSDPLVFELACANGKNYGIVITEDTKLDWNDKSAFGVWEGSSVDEWDMFGCDMSVSVTIGAEADSAEPFIDECVEKWYTAEKISVIKVNDDYFAVPEKPVIYLYPEARLDVTVELEFDGELVCTYPEYQNGWQVTARPDGTLTDANGRDYNYLYWEGVGPEVYDFSQGFCVAGEDTAAFLEQALEQLGLNRREANEFIVYWLPQMEDNRYNLIAFQSQAYTEHARLTVSPEPDTVLRVFMAWQSLEEAVDIPPQELTAPERSGFTLVEWGGARIGG